MKEATLKADQVSRRFPRPRKELVLSLLLFLSVTFSILSFLKPWSWRQIAYYIKFAPIILLCVLLLYRILVGGISIKISKAIRNVSILFNIWMFSMIVSLFNASYPVSGILLILSYAILYILAFYLLPNFLKRGDLHLRFNKTIFWGVLVSILISVVLGLNDPQSFYINPESGRYRYQAFFINPNFLGLFAFLGVLVTVKTIMLSRKKKYLLLLPGYLGLIFLSDSRASLFALLLFGLLVFLGILYSKLKRRNSKLMFIAYSVLIPTLIFTLFILVFGNFPYISSLNTFLSNRPVKWATALSSLRTTSKIFFGQGLGQGPYASITGLGSISYDNSFLNHFIQTGLFGELLLWSLIFIVIFYFCKINYSLVKYRYVHVLNFSMLFTWIAYSFFESPFFSLGNIVSIYIWVEVGIHLMGNWSYGKYER